MGGPTWSFQQSWGSNVTIGAGVLGAILTVAAFPAHPHLMQKNTYNTLQGLFAAIIALAPLVYGLLRRDVKVTGANSPVVEAQGYVIMFLFAGGLVLWGAFGQLATMAALIDEFIAGSALPTLIGVALEYLTAALFVLLLVYGLKSMYGTASQLGQTGPSASQQQEAGVVGPPGDLPAPQIAPAAGQRSEWPLL